MLLNQLVQTVLVGVTDLFDMTGTSYDLHLKISADSPGN